MKVHCWLGHHPLVVADYLYRYSYKEPNTVSIVVPSDRYATRRGYVGMCWDRHDPVTFEEEFALCTTVLTMNRFVNPKLSDPEREVVLSIHDEDVFNQ